MKLARCETCGWEGIPFSAVSCVRCGAARRRSSGMAAVSFAAAQKQALTAAFANSRILPGARSSGAPPAGVAWAGYGSCVALLVQYESGLALERFSLSARLGSGSEALSERAVLSDRLSSALLKELIAPPVIGRVATSLISSRTMMSFSHPDTRARRNAPQLLRWSPQRPEALIRAAALSPAGDTYIAVAAEDGDVRIHDHNGLAVAKFDHFQVGPGQGIGLAAQGRAGDVTIYIWSDGRIAWRRITGDEPGEVFTTELAELRAPALLWHQRLAAADPIAWHGWREAGAGVYPIMLGTPRQMFGALVFGARGPTIVRYHEGRPSTAALANAAALAFADQTTLRVIQPQTGGQLSMRPEAIAQSSLFCGLSSGSFISLHQQAADAVVLTAWTVRPAEIAKAFDIVLRSPVQTGASRAPLQLVSELPPLELDDGIAIALQEGAGASNRLRLWCEAAAVQPAERAS